MIGILIFPDFQLLDATGPASVFEIAQRLVPCAATTRMIAVQAGAVRSSSGVEVVAAELQTAEAMTTLVVAGGLGVDQAIGCRTTLALLRDLARRGVRIASVCSGAYVLAAAGLLNGRKATTHWCRTQDFVTRYPEVRLDPDRIFLCDGNIWTSAGITAGIDLALALMAEDHGDAVAKAIARQLVLYHRRGGGQSQFSSLLELKAPDGRFGALLSWVRENLDKPLTVESLAERAGLSPRHFARTFTAETGSTPSKAIERLRLEVARERVQSSGESIERVAETTGFGDAERMRRAFVRAFGHPPQSVRRTARLS
ncbi:GlxA family transcriptional regulator [Tistrella mobilis]|uniref:GlxA family transcriptional regulator n=1 Tax=Tistrella mobilis TaxID=171437 RepID=UPI003558F312